MPSNYSYNSGCFEWPEDNPLEEAVAMSSIDLDYQKTFSKDLLILIDTSFNPTLESRSWRDGVERWSRFFHDKYSVVHTKSHFTVWFPFNGAGASISSKKFKWDDNLYYYINKEQTLWLIWNIHDNTVVGVGPITKTDTHVTLSIFEDWKKLPNNESLCENCFQIVDKEKIEIFAGQGICHRCVKYLLTSCYSCGCKIIRDQKKYSPLTSHQTFKILKFQGEPYCWKCWQKKLIKCHACARIFEKESEDFEEGHTWGDRWYCQECTDAHFIECASCSGFNPRDLSIRIGMAYYCRTCSEKERVIKKYDFVPEQFKLNKCKEDNDLYLGVELEIETKTKEAEYEACATHLLGELKRIKTTPYFYLKHDGTVKGFELVSHPATLRYMHLNYKWNEILTFCKKLGWTSYKSGNCGLHVHLNRAFFNEYERKALRLFFSTNSFFLSKFSKREGNNVKYCHYEDLSMKMSDYLSQSLAQETKYYALRTHPAGKDTIEFRIFRGTLDYDRFLATLQFCDALAHFIKATNIITCSSKKSWIEFIKWTKQTCRYNHLVRYLQDKNKLLSVET